MAQGGGGGGRYEAKIKDVAEIRTKRVITGSADSLGNENSSLDHNTSKTSLSTFYYLLTEPFSATVIISKLRM